MIPGRREWISCAHFALSIAFNSGTLRLAIPMAVVKKFGDDQGGGLAALVAYYAFFSLFPLLLVFVTILGFVLQGDPSPQKSVENSVLGQFPVIGGQLHAHALKGAGRHACSGWSSRCSLGSG